MNKSIALYCLNNSLLSSVIIAKNFILSLVLFLYLDIFIFFIVLKILRNSLKCSFYYIKKSTNIGEHKYIYI